MRLLSSAAISPVASFPAIPFCAVLCVCLVVVLAGAGCARFEPPVEPLPGRSRSVFEPPPMPQRGLPPEPYPLPPEVKLTEGAPRAWPVEHSEREIISWFGPRGGGFHKGLDVKAPYRCPVLVTADGTVTFSGRMRGYGNVVFVAHSDDFSTGYGHLASRHVKVGDEVRCGDTVGLLGATGNATTRHVHYEVRHKDKPLDPVWFLPAE